MKVRNRSLLLPAILSVGIFFGLLSMMALTDPVQNVSYVLLFFAILLALLLSTGHFLINLKSGIVSHKARSKILIISVLLVVILMFRSAGSLNRVDMLVVVLLSTGLLFYSGRRPH